jgi:hypothetical protein
MSEKTVNLTLDNLKELFTHWADEMRKPVPPTPQEQAASAQAQQYRLENANSVKEKMERKRREQAVCTHRHPRKDGGASHVVHVYDNDYPGHPGYIYCQRCEVRIRPDDELWRKLDPGALFNNALFVELMADCPLTGAEIIG